MLPPAAARADAPPANPPPINLLTGATNLDVNNDTLNGINVNNYAGGIFVYGDGNIINNNDGAGQIPSADFIVDDAGGPAANNNYFGSTLITLNGGTFEYHGQVGPGGAGTPSTTVTNMAVATGGVINAQPQGGGGYLQITNLTVNPNATVTFESSWGSLGTNQGNPNDTNGDDIGKINITNLNGKAIANTNGIVGGWATTVSYQNSASGLLGFATVGPLGITEVTYDFDGVNALTRANAGTVPTGTLNIRTIGGGPGGSAEVLDGSTVAGGTFAYNSLVSNGGPGYGDINLLKGAQLVLNSGGLVMGDNGHWIKSDDGTGTLTAGPGGNYNLYASTNAGGANQSDDFRIYNVQITDNGTHPVTLIKGGTGRFILDPNSRGHETYTGGTIINDGTLEILAGGQTGTFAPHSTVTVNGGGTLQIDATDGLGWINASNPSDPNNGEVTVTVNAGGRLFANGGARVTLSDPLTLIGGILASSPTNGDGNGSYSIYGQVNATSAPTGPSQITAANVTIQNAQTVFNVTAGGNGPVDLLVNANVGEFQGSNMLVKNGNGVMTLASANTYSGGTTVNAGTLRVQNVNALGAGNVTLAGGTLQFASKTLGSLGTTLSGFSNFQLNNNGQSTASPVISPDNNTLTITDTTNGEARSAFFRTPVPFNNTKGFTASFVYTNVGGNANNPADGVTFVLQNDPRGNTALGDPGGNFGYGGGAAIINSVAAEFNIYGGAGGGRGIAFGINGSIPGNNGTGNVDLSNGDPIQVSLAYNGLARSLQETLTDMTNNNTFTTTFYGLDYQSIVGGASAFVGFTGGTGGLNSNQTISSFTFASSAFAAPSTETYGNAVAVVGDATLDVTGGRSVTVGPLSIGANNLTITNSDTTASPFSLATGAVTLGGNATFTVNNSAGGGPGTFVPGAIGGSFGITKAGAGTMLLTGNSNYTGPTVIQAGTVLANNATSSTGTGAVTVQSGAKLGGTGMIAAPVTVNAGGVISAGDAAVTPGKLVITGPTIFTQGGGAVGNPNNGTTYLWKINAANGSAGASTGWDQLQIQSLSLASGISGNSVTIQPISFSGTAPGGMAGFNPGQIYRWAVINVPTGGALPPASNFVLDTNALSVFAAANGVQTSAFSILEGADPAPGGGNDVFVQFNPAPEPTSLTLLGLGAGGLLLRRRRVVV